jgi:hypothetical protein
MSSNLQHTGRSWERIEDNKQTYWDKYSDFLERERVNKRDKSNKKLKTTDYIKSGIPSLNWRTTQ